MNVNNKHSTVSLLASNTAVMQRQDNWWIGCLSIEAQRMRVLLAGDQQAGYF